MVYNGIIHGKLVDLRSVTENDAAFILRLRLDDNLNKYINKVNDSIEEQVAWIAKQRDRDGDFYFIIQKKDETPIGTISLYHIDDKMGEFGRWVSVGNPFENVESVILLYDFGFYILNLNTIYSEIVRENNRVINFNRKFGAKVLEEFKEYNGFIMQKAVMNKENYVRVRERNSAILEEYITSLQRSSEFTDKR